MTEENNSASPFLGEIRKASDCGMKGAQKVRWDACEKCGKARWVQVNRPRKMCASCSSKQANKTWQLNSTEYFSKGRFVR